MYTLQTTCDFMYCKMSARNDIHTIKIKSNVKSEKKTDKHKQIYNTLKCNT